MKRLRLFVSALVLSLSSVFMLAAPSAFAATKTWTGGAGDHLFSTAGNWSPSGAPTTGDVLVFPNGVSDKAPENDINGLSVAGITFTGSSTSGYTISGAESLTLTGDITDSTTAVVSNVLSLDIDLGDDVTVTVPASHFISLDGVITGSNTLAKAGGGYLSLEGANSAYTGAISVNAGHLGAYDDEALGTSAAGTTVVSGATLAFCFSNDVTVAEPVTVGGSGLSGYGALTAGTCASSQTGKTVTLSGNIALTANTVVGGLYNLKVTGALSGAFKLSLKQGSTSTLIVSSSNNTSQTPNATYTAEPEEVTVNEGDDQPGTSIDVGTNSIYVIKGVRGDTTVFGVLKGTGTVGDLSVQPNGTVAPGLSPGCLNSGNLSLSGNYAWELGGTTACTGYDQIVVTGTVVAGGALNVSRFNGFVPTAGQKYVIVSNDGSDAVNGTFTGLAQGATFQADGVTFSVSYTGGDGNDIELTVTAVSPDTGFAILTNNPFLSMGLILGAAGALAFMARRQLKPAARRR